MWVRKAPEEISSERSNVRLAFGGPAMVFFLTFCLVALCTVSGPRHSGGQIAHWPTTWGELLRAAAVVSSIAGCHCWLVQQCRPTTESTAGQASSGTRAIFFFRHIQLTLLLDQSVPV